MQIGYMDDLTYYYLGHAAENLRYLQPAQKYYRIAEQISVTNMSCSQGEADAEAILGVAVNQCNGYTFPDALYPHLETVEAQLAAMSNIPPPPPTPHKRRVVRKSSPHTPAAAASSGAGQTSGSGFVVPTPTAGAPASAPASSNRRRRRPRQRPPALRRPGRIDSQFRRCVTELPCSAAASEPRALTKNQPI